MLVALTLFGALPVYRRVAEESPHGEGSIAMLERLLPLWKGKLFVLALLGFAATDFIDHDDAVGRRRDGAHRREPARPRRRCTGTRWPITLGLLALLGAVFLKGFAEAIGVAVGLVAVYLALNVVVVVVGLWRGGHGAGPGHRLVGRADHPARQPADDARRPRCWCSPRWRWACPASRPAWR